MRKRLFAVLLAVVVAATMTACTANKAKTDKNGTFVEIDETASDSASAMGSAEEFAKTSGGMADALPGRGSNGTGHADIPDDNSSALVLTAAEWNDNNNWPFFTNLVNSGKITFPSYGIDPRNRVAVTVTDESGAALRGETVVLYDAEGNVLWTAKTGTNGIAYLFYREGETPANVSSGDKKAALTVEKSDPDNQQGAAIVTSVNEVSIVKTPEAKKPNGVQVMFIIDTTGSMGDELAFLQKDFSKIAEDVGTDGVTYSVNFYRDDEDEYVTRCNGFTDDISRVREIIGAEVSEGGGDEPEAVAQILKETITDNDEWSEDAAKVAFMIFDAPPHEGTEDTLKQAIETAARKGIRLVPVVASNSTRDTELFGRAIAITTNGTYVFLTDDSGVGETHLEPIVGDYTVELLHDVIVRIISENR